MADDESLARQAAEDAVALEEQEAAADATSSTPAAPANTTSSASANATTNSTPKFVPHTSMPDMTGPIAVDYCPVDGMPADFCEYGGEWEEAKPWVLEHYPQFYPELAGLSLSDAKEKAGEAKAKADTAKAKAELPGGKKKKAAATPKLIVRVQRRQGKKMITSVIGMDMFDVKLEAAAKIFKKKFACGSAAVKGGPGMPDCVEIQGDPGKEDLLALLKKEWPELPWKKAEWELP